MNRKKKIISISLVAIVIIALASFNVYARTRSEELHRSRAYEAYLAAQDVNRKLSWFTDMFYDNIYELNATLSPENSNSNESNLRVIEWKCDLLDHCAERSWIDINEDLLDLSRLRDYDKEIPFFNITAFDTVHEAIQEALEQVAWATMAKGDKDILNEAPAFLWKLYYVLGIDQVVSEQPKSKMEGVSWCFNELESYWYAESYYGRDNLPKYLTLPQTALEWAVGNATALHEELIRWDEYHTPLLRARFINHYLDVMKNLNDAEMKNDIQSEIDKPYNLTELFQWEHERLEFVPLNETFDRQTDPKEILAFGKGRCEEFSIVYIAACLTLGYDARLVTSVDVRTWDGLHVWAEVKSDGSWIHVDPSDQVWNQTSYYETWGWGEIGTTVRVYAFENGKYEDVSSRYK